MSFPIDYQKEFCWPATMRNEKPLINAFVRIAVAELEGARASNIEAQDNSVQFTVRWFRWVGNWNLLTNIDKGVIQIAAGAGTFSVVYYLSFRRLLVQHCIGALGAFSFVTLPDRGLPTTLKILAPPVLFSVVFALNYLIAIRRFSRFIKRIIARADLESAGI
jgi:hypothetical protein